MYTAWCMRSSKPISFSHPLPHSLTVYPCLKSSLLSCFKCPSRKLLHHLNYNSSTDTVLLLGDVAAKHPSISASLHTIRFARTSGFLAIRGNHDQDIIAWRNWMEAHRKPSKTSDEADEERSLESVPEYEAETPPKELKHKLPKGWKWKSQHFEIARRLPQKDFRWLLSLSLTYHSETLQ